LIGALEIIQHPDNVAACDIMNEYLGSGHQSSLAHQGMHGMREVQQQLQ
jgi:hypothetical protein